MFQHVPTIWTRISSSSSCTRPSIAICVYRATFLRSRVGGCLVSRHPHPGPPHCCDFLRTYCLFARLPKSIPLPYRWHQWGCMSNPKIASASCQFNDHLIEYNLMWWLITSWVPIPTISQRYRNMPVLRGRDAFRRTLTPKSVSDRSDRLFGPFGASDDDKRPPSQGRPDICLSYGETSGDNGECLEA